MSVGTWSTTVRARTRHDSLPSVPPTSKHACHLFFIFVPNHSDTEQRQLSNHLPPPPPHTPHPPPRITGTDQLLLDIADYVIGYDIKSKDAVKTARYAIMDSLACALLALNFPECTKLLGPVVPGVTVTKGGAHVVGTEYDVDPVTAAQNLSTAIRWLDYNDAWLASEWWGWHSRGCQIWTHGPFWLSSTGVCYHTPY